MQDNPITVGQTLQRAIDRIMQQPKTTDNRITPAYAGKRKILAENGTGGRDHPRLCGEKADENVKSWLSRGITPAYAGKSQKGENHGRHEQGSPPPMRGKD